MQYVGVFDQQDMSNDICSDGFYTESSNWSVNWKHTGFMKERKAYLDY